MYTYLCSFYVAKNMYLFNYLLALQNKKNIEKWELFVAYAIINALVY